MSEHTPGPWRIDLNISRLDILSADHSCVATLRRWPLSKKLDQRAIADARLIAAAPKLLKALKGVLAITQDGTGVAGYHMNGDVAEWDEFDEIEIALKAVAEAEGKP